jgi:hypothetical protein
MTNKTLKDSLSEWQDFDGAAHELANCLGLMDESVDFATDAKHVYWSANPVGTALNQCLQELSKAGILEFRDEPDVQYRWNLSFKGSWE